MKYILIETFFGWLTRPVLLWNLGDILIIALEIAVVGLWVSSVRDLVRRRKANGKNKSRRTS
ncbi:MAG: hypothetical protein J6D03_06665 [Clostridia bacterium]|nr:hypothetical protein [Clostridia bacterium]